VGHFIIYNKTVHKGFQPIQQKNQKQFIFSEVGYRKFSAQAFQKSQYQP